MVLQFQKTEHSLGELLEEVPKFNTTCEQFMRRCAEIKSERQVNSISLAKHGTTLQLLEAPQLMDNLIREGHYDDALRLAAYIRKLDKTHGPSIPIIRVSAADLKSMFLNAGKNFVKFKDISS